MIQHLDGCTVIGQHLPRRGCDSLTHPLFAGKRPITPACLAGLWAQPALTTGAVRAYIRFRMQGTAIAAIGGAAAHRPRASRDSLTSQRLRRPRGGHLRRHHAHDIRFQRQQTHRTGLRVVDSQVQRRFLRLCALRRVEPQCGYSNHIGWKLPPAPLQSRRDTGPFRTCQRRSQQRPKQRQNQQQARYPAASPLSSHQSIPPFLPFSLGSSAFFVTFLSIMQSSMHSAKPPLPLRYARLHGAMRPQNCRYCDIFIPHHNRSRPNASFVFSKFLKKNLVLP